MSTRGAYGFYKGRKSKLTYNHSDSYPECLGAYMISFIKETPTSKMREIFDNIVMVDEDRSAPSEIQANEVKSLSDNWYKLNPGTQLDWYELLRPWQGSLKAYAAEKPLRYMVNSESFMGDSLFCEYAYVINLNKEVLEFYGGFQKKVSNNRYKKFVYEKEDYKNVKLVLEIPFKTIRDTPTEWIVNNMVQATSEE